MVWAGYQKKGIVFLNTKPHCLLQSICAKRSAMGMGVMSALRLPPWTAMWASVILWKVMKTGAKIVFIATETASATHNLSIQKSALLKLATAPVIPIYSISAGVPFEKIIIAALMPMPRSPQTIIRGKMPNALGKNLPQPMRQPSISPSVESTPNLMKLITIPCAALNDLYPS